MNNHQTDNVPYARDARTLTHPQKTSERTLARIQPLRSSILPDPDHRYFTLEPLIL